jgi:hypothetical protein
MTRLRAELEAQKEIAVILQQGQQNACEQLDRVTGERDALRKLQADGAQT